MQLWIFDPSCRLTYQGDYDSHISWARGYNIDLTRPAKFDRFGTAVSGQLERYTVHLIFDTGFRAGEPKHVITHCFKPLILNQSLEDYL